MYLFRIRLRYDFIALAGYFLISIFILGGILFSPGTVGFFHDWVLGPYPEMMYSWSIKSLYIWDTTYGNKIYPTDWLLRFLIFTPFSFIGGEGISKGLLSLVVTLSGIGGFCLARQFKFSWLTSFAAGAFYIFSPIIFTRIISGQFYYLIAYALSPFIVLSFLKGREENKDSYFIICGILISFATSQLQFFPMIFIVLLIFSLIDYKKIRKNLRGLLIVFSLAFVIVLLPIVLSQISVKLPSDVFFNPAQLLMYHATTTASDLLESFRLLGYEVAPYSYSNLGTPRDLFESNVGIIPSWIFYLNFIIPIVGFSSLLIYKDRYILSFAVISLVGLFLLKGPNPPFGGLFALLFVFSGFYIFREVWHMAFLYGFSITFMASFFIEKLITYKTRTVFFRRLLPLGLITIIIVANGYPLLTTNFAGYVQTYNLPMAYHPVYESASSNENDYNVLVLPLFSPMRYDGLKLDGTDPLLSNLDNQIFPIYRFNRPHVPLVDMATWLLSTMQENKTDSLGKLLSGLGIKYIILRRDFMSNFIDYNTQNAYPDLREKWHRYLEPFLDKQKDLTAIFDATYYKIYENNSNATKFFVPTMHVTGLSDFNNLLLITNLSALSTAAVYPSNYDNSSSINFVDTVKERKMPINNFIEIGGYTNLTDPSNGWTNNRHWFGYRHVLDSRLHQGAFTTSHGSVFSFDLPSKKYLNRPIEIWIKALEWNKGGTVDTNINGKNSSLNLFSLDQRFDLYKVYEGTPTKPIQISIRNIDGGNYVEGIYLKEKQKQLTTDTYNSNKTFIVSAADEKRNYLLPNPTFLYWQDGLPLYWNTTLSACNDVFRCELNINDGWKDNMSLEISTASTEKNTWSLIRSTEINVKPNEIYEIVTHMKLNPFASGSHIATEGFNQTSNQWHQIVPQCPYPTNGPLEWHMFSCEVAIPKDTNKLRVVLNGGWSSQENQEGITFFDGIYLSKLSDKSNFEDIIQKRDILLNNLFEGERATLKEYSQVNPTLYKVKINAVQPFTLAFTQSYDPAWKVTVYKNGKIIDADNSIPLYGVINAFEINETGNLDLEIRYTRQDWFEIGIIISLLTLISCMVFLLYSWKLKPLKQKVRKKFSIS